MMRPLSWKAAALAVTVIGLVAQSARASMNTPSTS